MTKHHKTPKSYGFARVNIEQDAINAIDQALNSLLGEKIEQGKVLNYRPGLSYKAVTKSDFLKFLVKLYQRGDKERIIKIGDRGSLGTVMFDTQEWKVIWVYLQGKALMCSVKSHKDYYIAEAKRLNPAMFREV